MTKIVIIGSVFTEENREVMETIKNQVSEFISDASIITPLDPSFKTLNISTRQDIFVDSIINSDLIICIPSNMEFSDYPEDTYLASYDTKCDSMTNYELTLARALGKPIIYIDQVRPSLSPETTKRFVNSIYGIVMDNVEEDKNE